MALMVHMHLFRWKHYFVYLEEIVIKSWKDKVDLYSHGGIVMRAELAPLHVTQTLFHVYEVDEENCVIDVRWTMVVIPQI